MIKQFEVEVVKSFRIQVEVEAPEDIDEKELERLALQEASPTLKKAGFVPMCVKLWQTGAFVRDTSKGTWILTFEGRQTEK